VKTDPTFWILARASGLTAYAVLTASVLMGLVVKSRPLRSLKPAVATDLHRFLSTLAIGAVAVHGITLVLDQAVPLSIQALVIPGIAAYKPLWTGIGVAAAELMVLIITSFSLRRIIGARRWRLLHWATYAVFAAATAHGIAAGTDTRAPWALALYGASLAAVTAAAAWRTLVPPTRPAVLAPRASPAKHPATSQEGGSRSERIPHRDRPVAV
jgi:sulfoxide reductase heme-binding subunit YedZ